MVGTEPVDIFFFSLIIIYIYMCVCVCEERKGTRLESVEAALHCVVTTLVHTYW